MEDERILFPKQKLSLLIRIFIRESTKKTKLCT